MFCSVWTPKRSVILVNEPLLVLFYLPSRERSQKPTKREVRQENHWLKSAKCRMGYVIVPRRVGSGWWEDLPSERFWKRCDSQPDNVSLEVDRLQKIGVEGGTHFLRTGKLYLVKLEWFKISKHPHRIHVWYIYLHLANLYGKCR